MKTFQCSHATQLTCLLYYTCLHTRTAFSPTGVRRERGQQGPLPSLHTCVSQLKLLLPVDAGVMARLEIES